MTWQWLASNLLGLAAAGAWRLGWLDRLFGPYPHTIKKG